MRAASGGCYELDADLAADRGIRIRRRVLASSPGTPIDNKVSVARDRLARGSRDTQPSRTSMDCETSTDVSARASALTGPHPCVSNTANNLDTSGCNLQQRIEMKRDTSAPSAGFKPASTLTHFFRQFSICVCGNPISNVSPIPQKYPREAVAADGGQHREVNELPRALGSV